MLSFRSMNNSFQFLLFIISYIILHIINGIQAVPPGFLLGATYRPGSVSNLLCKINPLTGEFTTFISLDDYKAYDLTYDIIHKKFYIFGSQGFIKREAQLSVLVVNPFNGTKQYRPITSEDDTELFGLRVDSSTGQLYSLQMIDLEKNPVSIVHIDPITFHAKRWANITKSDGIQPDSMAIFYNSTHHQYFVTVAGSGYADDLVGVDLVQRKVISRISNSNLPAYLCYDNTTNAFYGMQEVQGKRACRLVRLNPYNGTLSILSHDFNDYLSSTGTCYGGFYFTMIVEKLDTQKIVTFDLINGGKIVANSSAEDYLDAIAFVPL
ncbi:hypothetical protein I4U23_011216 [Adineta vaga]|nr:hypothetical protein I4U23_011216 [Adineta vaga]